ncbi:hypothetical protein BLNAU_16077 [Blattamonas nauphoetae]|uniref:4Fe-4S ferredoxin-type domain-containing protein n=1 Tax=Blattamonas nauphoetae TaxID=2049346 RepID=A0ABQ9XF96_9EUKA|nr:hypothetical protein BLNAU_16077 [Blattamonas nauphoetae]
MRFTLIHFSSTGNTRAVAKLLEHDLTTKHNHEVTLIDGMALIKDLRVGQKTRQKSDPLSISSTSPLLVSARSAIYRSDVVGVGSYTTFDIPAPGFGDIFSEECLPKKFFVNLQYYFGFATQGAAKSSAAQIAATTVGEKNGSARFAGTLIVQAPDSTPVWGPPKPFIDPWSAASVKKIHDFADQLNSVVNQDGKTPKLVLKPKAYKGSDPQKMMSKMLKTPKIDAEKCIKCGKCARECPYNAISLKGDIENGYPVVDGDLCWACGRCYHDCPQEAIWMRLCVSEKRSRVNTQLLPETESDAIGTGKWATTRVPEGMTATTSKAGQLRTLHRTLLGVRWLEYLVLVLGIVGVVYGVYRVFPSNPAEKWGEVKGRVVSAAGKIRTKLAEAKAKREEARLEREREKAEQTRLAKEEEERQKSTIPYEKTESTPPNEHPSSPDVEIPLDSGTGVGEEGEL